MGIFFTTGEKKTRPGIYLRYENAGGGALAGAQNGVAALAFQSNWGPLGEVVRLNSAEEASRVFGSATLLQRLFEGGATTVKAVRVGDGGQASSATLMDVGESPADAVVLRAKQVGSRGFSYSLREARDSGKRELVLLEGQAERERLTFSAADSGEAQALVDIVNARSAYLSAAMAESYEGSGKLALATGTLADGQDPAVSDESYRAGLAMLEPERWNTIAVDSQEPGVHGMLAAFMQRVYQEGKMGFAVVGEPVSVPLETRMEHASALNAYTMVYVGGGWQDASGNRHEGADAAAYAAGMIAACPSSQSLTHVIIPGAVSALEKLTNSQYEQAIAHGMLTFSTSSTGAVWVDDAITTLVTPSGEDDMGWSKIKRAKIRFEVMSRVSDTVEPQIGNTRNDSDGRSNIMQLVQGVLNSMIAEGKLLPGAGVTCDSFEGDGAWFRVTADDIDSLEKIYFTFQFRYAA